MPRWPDMDDSKQCTATAIRTGERCQRARIPGATVCATHGGSIGRVKDAAARRVQEQQAMAAAERLVAGVDLSRYADPFAALEFAVSYSYALTERLAGIVSAIPDDQLRYRGKTGEQLRGEVTAAQRALDGLRQAATDALKLNLAEKRMTIRQQTADMLERALDAALEASGVGLDGKHAARQVFRANIRVAQAEPEGQKALTAAAPHARRA